MAAAGAVARRQSPKTPEKMLVDKISPLWWMAVESAYGYALNNTRKLLSVTVLVMEEVQRDGMEEERAVKVEQYGGGII
jgi:hypothetical protein